LLKFWNGIVCGDLLTLLAPKKCIDVEAGQGLNDVSAPLPLGFRRN
jgi:hypothetical protein